MKKKVIKGILALGVIVVGIYMCVNYDFPTAPAVSGLGFILAGLGQWTPVCPICNKLCKS